MSDLAPTRLLAILAPVLLAGSLLAVAALGSTHQPRAQVPRVIWAAPVGETDLDTDEIDGIAIDGAGNTFVSGVFRGEVRFGDVTYASRGEGDIFLASFAPDGRVRWSKQFGATGDDNTFDLQTDGSNVVASGWFAGAVDFGGVTLRSQGGQEMFLAKFDGGGRTVWARSFGGPSGDGGNELDVLPNGEIAVAALSDGAFTVDGRTYPFGGGSRDTYALRVSRGGAVRWVRPFAGLGTERIRAMAMNSAGEVFAGFQYRGSVTSGQATVLSRGDWDGAAAKLSAAGEPVWLVGVGGAGVDNVRGIGPGPGGSIYASGVFEGPARIVDRDVGAIGAGGDDFLMRLEPGGASRWLLTSAGPGPSAGAEIRSDPAGVIASSLVSGPTTLALDGQPIATAAPPGGLASSYLSAFTPEGGQRFAYMPTPIGAGAGALGDVLAISPDGRHVAQALRFRGTLQAGKTTFATSSDRDSAVLYLRTDANARARFGSVKPRRLALAPGQSRRLAIGVRNAGTATAKGVSICATARGPARVRLRLGGCARVEAIGVGEARTARLRLTVKGRPAGPGPASAKLRLALRSDGSVAAVRKVAVRIGGR